MKRILLCLGILLFSSPIAHADMLDGTPPSFRSRPIVAGNGLTATPGCTAVGTCKLSMQGCLDILSYGGNGNGVAANDAAFAAAYSALGSLGGCVYFPAGKYLFASRVAETLPNSQFGLQVAGDGIGATTLYWPNAAGGILLTASTRENVAFIHDMSLTTAQLGSGAAIEFVGAIQGSNPTTTLQNLQIAGDNLLVDYWGYGVYIHNWSAVNLINVNTFGTTLGAGIGLMIEGDTPTTSYATLINVSASSFNSQQYGVELGSYWQGITFGGGTQFNGAAGTAGIYEIPSAAGVLVLLSVSNCEFAYNGQNISINTSIDSVQLIGNFLTAPAGTYSVNLGSTLFSMVTGNFFTGASNSGGVETTGDYGAATANVFSNMASGVGIALQSGSTRWSVALNSYDGIGTDVSNVGSNNSVGTASAGNMTGVVP